MIYTDFNSDVDIEKLFDKYIKKLNLEVFDMFQSPNDLKAATAIIQIFERRKTLDLSNKKLIYIYVKEMVDVQTNTITRVIKKLKTVYKVVLNEYLQEMEY